MQRARAASASLTVLLGLLSISVSAPTVAQEALSARLIPSRAPTAAVRAPVPVAPGARVRDPSGLSEIILSDGSTIALDPGATFTLRSATRDASGRALIQGVLDGGKARIASAERTMVVLHAGTAEVEIDGATAVVQAGPAGSVTLVGGRRVIVRATGREEVLRRPGFAVAFDGLGTQRRSGREMGEELDRFAPVAMGGNSVVLVGGAPSSRRVGRAGCTVRRNTSAPSSDDPSVACAPNVEDQIGSNYGGNSTPLPSLPLPPSPPPDTPPTEPPLSRRQFANLSLLERRLEGRSSQGSAIAAGGANSNTSIINGDSDLVARGPESGAAAIAGVATVQKEGTVRVRRFAPPTQRSATQPQARDDSGVVRIPDDLARNGVPATAVGSTYFSNLHETTLPRGLQQTFYDAIADIGIDKLRVFEKDVLNKDAPQFDFTVLRDQYVDVPRFYISDKSIPSMTYYNQSFTVDIYDRTSGSYSAQRSPTKLTNFAPPEVLALLDSGRVYIATGGPGSFLQIDELTRSGLQPVVNNNNFDEADLQTARQNLGASATGPVYFARRNGQIFGVHQAGAVFEIELQQRRVPAVTSPASATGQVFALAGENGRAVQVGQSALPGITVVRQGFRNADVTFGPGAQDFSAETELDIRGLDLTVQGSLLSLVPTNVSTEIPDVVIIDKITSSSEAIRDERGINPGERFFVIGGRGLPAPGNGGLPGPGGAALGEGTVTRFAISDGLNATGGFEPGSSVRQQFLDGTYQPVAFRTFNAFRPEGTFVGYDTPSVARGDTHLLTIAGTADRNPVMRSDIEVAPDGRSSVSVTVGGFARLPAGDRSMALSGVVIGSSRVGAPRDASVAITSNLGSLGTDATGYGTHIFGGAEGSDITGQIGYFAVGEADTRQGAPGTAAGVQPGSLDPVGGSGAPLPFAFTRLATNVGAPSPGSPRGPLGGGPDGIQGFGAAIVEVSPEGGGKPSLHTMVGTGLGDVTIRSRNGDRELEATYRLAPHALGEISTEPPAAPAPTGQAARTLTFGGDGNSGAVPTSAVASQATFAAVIPGQAAMTSVDADLLNGIRQPDGRPSELPPSNEHVAWGAFLGNLVPKSGNKSREYANLGFWVAGRPVDNGTLQTLAGSATYRGGMIGNVADTNGLRTAVGDFTHEFNFARRQGNLSAQFDGASFANIATGMPTSGNVYSGSGPGTVGRVLSAQGAFFHNPSAGGAVSSANLPRATGGVFGVAGDKYGANGIFVGTRR